MDIKAITRSALCAVVAAAIAYLFLISLFGTEQAAYTVCNFAGFPEGTTVLSGSSFWPPGTHCLYRLPAGSVVERTGGFYAIEGTFIGLVAAAGAPLPFVVCRIRQRRLDRQV